MDVRVLRASFDLSVPVSVQGGQAQVGVQPRGQSHAGIVRMGLDAELVGYVDRLGAAERVSGGIHVIVLAHGLLYRFLRLGEPGGVGLQARVDAHVRDEIA